MKPICYDLYCGLGGWAEGFLSEGFRCIGYDIEKHDYGTGTYPGELILCDVRSIHGSQLVDAACIVASPPCQEPSYRAMPWSRAKALNAIGPPHLFIELFNACFRIHREASEAAGRYIPIVIENVRGAQEWVGKARANFGSYYLWGDVGQIGHRVVVLNGPIGRDVGIRSMRGCKVPGFRFDGSGGSFQSASVKVAGQNWSRYAETGEVSPHWRMEAQKGIPHKPTGHWTCARENGTKFSQSGDAWFDGKPRDKMLGHKGPAAFGSKSDSRKAASAEIAKIPFPLAQHIARCFKFAKAATA